MSLLDFIFTPGTPARGGTRMSKGVSYVGRLGNQVSWDSDDDTMSAVVYRCIQAIAAPASSLDLEVLVNDEVADGHPIADLFNRRPNPLTSARVFKEVLFSRLEWKGEVLVYLDRGESGTGPITDAWIVYSPFKPVIDKEAAGEEALLGFQVDVGTGKKVGLLPSETLWLRYPDPDDAWGCVAPWKAARFAAEMDREVAKWQRKEVQSGGRAQSLVYLGDLTEDQHDAAVADFNASIVSGHKRHLLVSGPTPAGVERLGATAEELAYMESRLMNREEACLAFGVPKDALLGGSTYENQRSAKRMLWSDTIVPKLETVASEVDRQALDGDREEAAFNVSEVEALQENADALATRTNGQVMHDLLTLDEGRARFGLEPLPNGLGNCTLTEYRRRVFSVAEAAVSASDAARALTAGVSARRIIVGGRGLRVLARPVERRQAPPVLERRGTALDVDEVQARYDRHEERGRKAAERLFKAQERSVLRALSRLEGAERKRLRLGAGQPLEGANLTRFLEARVTADSVLDVPHWRQATAEALEGFMAAVWDDGGQRTANALGLSFQSFDPRVQAEMAARLDVLADQVTETTRRILEDDVLGPGVAAGASTDDLADAIQARFAGFREWRALMIARTETVGGFNAAARVAALESGVTVARTWMAASDARVRDSHAALNGYRTSGLEDPYPNGCRFPGDPAGPSAETVNCRCVETWETEA